ncbi:hypothetical protein IWZ01DRAFT_495627 [Phyllosticta capitalensis]
MPKFLVPRNTGTHRVAAIALYRALLTSCGTVPIAAEDRQPLRNVVRKKFRRNKLVHSSRLLTLAFNSGYDTLDLFDRAAEGDLSSTQHISELLSQTPPHLKRPPPRPRLPKKIEGRPFSECPPPEQQLLETRPYVTVPGKRKVPKLRVNNGIPFLMYSKPQPLSLGRILRWKNDKTQKRMDWTQAVEHEMLPEAQQEDNWDDMLEAVFGIGDSDNPDAHDAETEGDHKMEGEGGDTNRWTSEANALHHSMSIEHIQQKTNRTRTARLMQGIIDREEVLAQKEKAERKSFKTMNRQLKAKRFSKLIEDDQF